MEIDRDMEKQMDEGCVGMDICLDGYSRTVAVDDLAQMLKEMCIKKELKYKREMYKGKDWFCIEF